MQHGHSTFDFRYHSPARHDDFSYDPGYEKCLMYTLQQNSAHQAEMTQLITTLINSLAVLSNGLLCKLSDLIGLLIIEYQINAKFR